MITYNPLLCCDFYKVTHANQYPANLTKLVSYYVPRMSRLTDINKVTLFGLQAFIKEYLIDAFNRNFFWIEEDEMLRVYMRVTRSSINTDGVGEERLLALHRLGYLPLKIRALPEGTRSNIGIPQIEISNTHPDFCWLVNAIESMMSATMWHTQLSAEVGYRYRQIVDKYADMTCDDHINHATLLGDFSMRGQESVESATKSSAAFALSFVNTATVPAVMWLEDNYICDARSETVVRGAISTEHSVMCSNFAVDGDEITHIRRLLTEIYPHQSFSMVSDSYDYWNLIDNILPELKEEILAHDGTLSIRGDSGDPVEIVTQTVFHLWNTFGGTVNSKGYKVLDPHVKAIYGDSITPQRCEEVYRILMMNGFAINNVSLGVGSFSFQCLEEFSSRCVDTVYGTMFENLCEYKPYTRDTFGIAVKATYAEDENGNPILIQKKPKTDTANFKTSHKGCCRVTKDNYGEYSCEDGLTWEESQVNNLLTTVFENSRFTTMYSLHDIRSRLHNKF